MWGSGLVPATCASRCSCSGDLLVQLHGAWPAGCSCVSWAWVCAMCCKRQEEDGALSGCACVLALVRPALGWQKLQPDSARGPGQPGPSFQTQPSLQPSHPPSLLPSQSESWATSYPISRGRWGPGRVGTAKASLLLGRRAGERLWVSEIGPLSSLCPCPEQPPELGSSPPGPSHSLGVGPPAQDVRLRGRRTSRLRHRPCWRSQGVSPLLSLEEQVGVAVLPGGA